VTQFLLRLVVSAVAVIVAQRLFWPYVRVEGQGSDALVAALLFALVLGVLNALVRPVLLLLTCPLNLITLGLFVFVVNAAVFWMATLFPVGVQVDGFLGALIGSLAVSICSALASLFIT
jgi:putative membrane protein